MLNNEKQTILYTNRCLSDCDYIIIARSCDEGNDNVRVVMTQLSDSELELISKRQSIKLKRGCLVFDVHPQYVVAYGELDLSPNSEDIKQIDSTGAFDRHTIRIFMPSEYHYDSHTVVSDMRQGRWYETSWCVTFLPYLYACINKPKNTIIFKEYHNFKESIINKRNQKYRQKYYSEKREKLKEYMEMRKKERRKAKIKNLKFNIKY